MTLTAPIHVSCPTCDSRFPVDPDKVPPEGVNAICSSCWRVFSIAVEAGETEIPRDEEPLRAEEPPSPAEAPSPGAKTAAPAEPEGASPVEASFEAEVETEPEQEQETASPQEEKTSVEEIEWSPFEDLGAVAREAAYEVESPSPKEKGDPEGEDAPSPPAVSFGRQDPHTKARRLARVLVSDMVTYHPKRHARAVTEGSVEEEFEEEVQKSWEEYVGQVGAEIAEGTRYFQDALNEILARGESIY